MATIAEALALAVQHHQADNLAQAEQIYRQILQANPAEPNALRLLGMLAHQMGAALAKQGRLPEAVARLREAVRLWPDDANALNHLGAALAELGRLPEGLDRLREALRLQPDLHEAHYNLGMALAAQGKPAEALASYEQAVRIKPDYAEALNNLGAALTDQGRITEGLARVREALRLQPELPEPHYNLGIALTEHGKLDEALASYEQAVRIKPEYADALNNLAKAYREQGRLDEAIACYRKAIAAKPGLQAIRSNLLYTLLYHPGYEPEAIYAEHLRWAGQFGASPAVHQPFQPVNRDPGRRLRLGYVSPDFREHVMGRYSEAVIAAHDRAQFEVFCYANVPQADARTQRIKASADHWRSLVGLSDARAADLIRQDQIDLLIDLAGHTAGNRLGVFAQKPAPIQVTHLGYAATTGLAAVDYRLTDAHYDPPGGTERCFTEKLVRLPEVQWCYLPPSDLEVGPVPARRAGHVTFGSFNNLCKVTEQMIGLWSQILNGLPESRMVVLTGAGSAGDERVLGAFVRHGVDQERVTLVGRQSQEAFYGLHQTVDICLDTFPFSGGFTTADALWMGVPVVSLAGAASASRQGVAVLVLVGLEDLATDTPAAYALAAIRLAQDLSRLDELRWGLRERLRRTLGNVQRFTRQLEAAYRGMWEHFCQENQGSAH